MQENTISICSINKIFLLDPRMVDPTFSHFLLCTCIETCNKENKNVEGELKELGYSIGRSLTEIYSLKRETDINNLMYNITYKILDKVHSSSRKLEVSDNIYYILEYESFYGPFVSLPGNYSEIVVDSFVCGVIEYILLASGYKSVVNGYLQPTEKYPDSVVYQIQLM